MCIVSHFITKPFIRLFNKEMQPNIVFSIIIPQRNSLQTLSRLFASIPETDNIEIILVDNSPEPVTKEQVGINRDYQLLWSSPSRFAGGARNEGMDHAQGKWLTFSDADDYFAPGAFDIFDQYKDSDADVIYFCADGVYPETGERSEQADLYTQLVQNYLKDPSKEWGLRLSFHVPWAKMVRRSFVEEHHIRYDEVVANNDDYFSLVSGYHAKKIEAVDRVVYFYVVSHGSLMRRRSLDVMRTRYEVILRCNHFKKQHGLGKYQGSVMYFLAESRHYGVKAMWEFFTMLFKYRQNPFIGMTNWFKTAKRIRNKEKKDARFIVNQ